MSKKIAYFDMDGSLFDYDKSMRDYMLKLKAPDEPDYPGNFHDWERIPHLNERMILIKNQPDWWFNLEPIEMGFEVFNLAKELGFNCRILTKGPRRHPNSFSEKLRCCQYYFGTDVKVDIVQNKELLKGDVLYDDFIPYMKKWLEQNPSGLGLMPINDSNRKWYSQNLIKHDGSAHNLEKIKAKLIEVLKS